jgi:uncharacterized protein YcbK (DUF882 family)
MTAMSMFSNVIHANTDNSSERTLSFINLHTHEELHSKYWVNGEYDTKSLNDINYIMRDHRANEVHEISTNLIDVLYTLHVATESSAPFHIISAYRSPVTNKKLRDQTSGVAKKSLHMQGMAIDIRLPDVELERLRDTAISLKAGGVGYYAKSNFIHIDIGKPRNW